MHVLTEESVVVDFNFSYIDVAFLPAKQCKIREELFLCKLNSSFLKLLQCLLYLRFLEMLQYLLFLKFLEVYSVSFVPEVPGDS
jgi:hypothetical protein